MTKTKILPISMRKPNTFACLFYIHYISVKKIVDFLDEALEQNIANELKVRHWSTSKYLEILSPNPNPNPSPNPNPNPIPNAN